jgi:two-component system, OmpR family, response regulator
LAHHEQKLNRPKIPGLPSVQMGHSPTQLTLSQEPHGGSRQSGNGVPSTVPIVLVREVMERGAEMRVLIVEDSGPTRDLLTRSLEDAGVKVDSAARISTGLRQAMSTAYDVIILDLMLPDGDGLDLCRELRASGLRTPILCLTARAEVADRVRGLDVGADDYLRKPFALAELNARVRALARRGGVAPPTILEAGGTHVDFTGRSLRRRGAEIPLTAREWAVLELLAARAGRLVSRTDLLESVWHEVTPAAAESLDVIMSRLRRKLGNPQDGCSIRTVRGEGFVFELQK